MREIIWMLGLEEEFEQKGTKETKKDERSQL